MIELPFPPASLSPNSRVHWAVKAKQVRRYKIQCAILIGAQRSKIKGRASFDVTFHPPSGRRYDTDNLIARFKAGQDALSLVTGIDDAQFVMTYRRGAPVEGGKVVLS